MISRKNIRLLEAFMIPQGYEIFTAANGKEALSKLDKNQIDLILLDVMMPDMGRIRSNKKGSGK